MNTNLNQLPRVSIDVSAVPSKPAGAGLYVWEMVGAFARLRSDNFTLIARKDDGLRWQSLSERFSVHNKVPESRPLRLVWEQTSMARLLEQSTVDVHHGPHYTLPSRTSAAQVVTVHDMTFFDHPEWHEKAKVLFFRRAIASSIKRANHVIAVSNDTANKLKQRFGELPVTVIPHGVDHTRFNRGQDLPLGVEENDGRLLATHGISGDFIAFVGTIEPRKNVPGLIKAFDRIAEKFPDLKLVLAGRPGWGVDAVDEAQGFSPNAQRIIRPGYLPADAIPAMLRQAKVVAYPSLEEGFGLPALEALACGAVLVTTSGSAMEEVVGDAALLVQPGSIEQLAASLEIALIDEALRRALKARGPQIASEYTWDACAHAHLQVYAEAGRH